MPANMWVQEIIEIIGETCCEPQRILHKKRKNGSGNAKNQMYCVRGYFLEDDGDAEDKEEDNVPEPNTFWVEEADLLETIQVNDVREALVARHEAVLEGLERSRERVWL